MIKIADTVYQGYERENFVQENKCSYKTYLYNMYIKIQLHGSMCVNINCLRTRLLYFIFIFAFLNSGLVYLLNNTKQPSSGGLMTAVNVICTNFFGKKKIKRTNQICLKNSLMQILAKIRRICY